MKHKAKEFVQAIPYPGFQLENLSVKFPLFGNSVVPSDRNLPVLTVKMVLVYALRNS